MSGKKRVIRRWNRGLVPYSRTNGHEFNLQAALSQGLYVSKLAEGMTSQVQEGMRSIEKFVIWILLQKMHQVDKVGASY